MEPKPQSRPRFGNGRTYESADMKLWKRQFIQHLKRKRFKKIESGPIAVCVTFYVKPPLRISKAKTKNPLTNQQLEKVFVDKKPDLDNYLKAVWDSCNGILYKDDGQIAVTTAQKLYSNNPRIYLEIFELEEEKCSI
ncbi:MAG: RusA family crossover junction endodeoxyribonuclease [Enterococcus sp.]